jgi:pimeloyl-ACP methyl ester carboxylesterase
MSVTATAELITVGTPHGPVRVRDTGGHGDPLLLVHSLLVDGDLYARLIPFLVGSGYRCIVPELPLGAHLVPMNAAADLTPPGLARLLAEILDALGVEAAHVVGVDTGGALAQLLMAGHRDRVGRVILTACDAYDDFPPRSLGPLLAPLRAPGMLWVLAQLARLGPVRRLAVSQPLTHAGVDEDTLRRWTRPLRAAAIRRDLRKVLAGLHPRFTLAAAEANRDFPRPVLIAWGDDARVFPRRLADRLAADLPDARLVTLPDCAAFAALDQPRLLASLIDEHLTRALR